MMGHKIPLYVQLQDIIIEKIENKDYLPGEAIPSERRMEELYGMNRMTVKRAVNKLVEQGILYKKHGAGTFVAKNDHQNRDLCYLDSSGNAEIILVNKYPDKKLTTKLLNSGSVSDCRFLNHQLKLPLTESVWGMHRIRLVDEQPLCVEQIYVPKKFFTGIDSFDFSRITLYDYMDSKDHLPIHFQQHLIVCNATPRIAELLQIEDGSAIYKLEYLGIDSIYNTVEYTKCYINPAIAEFRIRLENQSKQIEPE